MKKHYAFLFAFLSLLLYFIIACDNSSSTSTLEEPAHSLNTDIFEPGSNEINTDSIIADPFGESVSSSSVLIDVVDVLDSNLPLDFLDSSITGITSSESLLLESSSSVVTFLESSSSLKLVESSSSIIKDLYSSSSVADTIVTESSSSKVDLFASLKKQGFNAVRLRVWVNPKAYSAKLYSGKNDVVIKAKRAHAQGLDVMIDFHYSDFFTDPGRQEKPSDWENFSKSELTLAIEEHTKDVLNAVKATGANVKWVQVGNELNAGMLWDSDVSISGASYDESNGGAYTNGIAGFKKNFSNIADFIKAGSVAAKSVFPNARVIIHLANAYESLTWWLNALYAAESSIGNYYDIVGFSHYPQNNDGVEYETMNSNAISTVETFAKTYGKEIFICEIGTKYLDSNADNAMQDFINKLSASSYAKYVSGIFYWEPQVYAWWKPAYYTTAGWNAYDMGAYTQEGTPSSTLSILTSSTIENVGADVSWVTEMEDDGVMFFE